MAIACAIWSAVVLRLACCDPELAVPFSSTSTRPCAISIAQSVSALTSFRSLSGGWHARRVEVLSGRLRVAEVTFEPADGGGFAEARGSG